MQSVFRVLTLALVVLTASVAFAVSAPMPVRWAPRLEGGPIRVLFIAPGFALRDVDELASRLQMKYETATVWDSAHLAGPGQSEAGVVESLRNALAGDFDVLVAGNIELGVLPENVLAAIQSKVAAGKGLVLANYRYNCPPAFQEFLQKKAPDDSAADITRGVGEAMTTEWPSNLDFVSAGMLEKGRVVDLDYPGERPSTHFLVPGLTDPLRARPEYLDVYLSLVARAVRWAAGRRPAIAVASIEDAGPAGPTDEEIPPGLPAEYVQQIKDGVARSLFHPYIVRLAAPADKAYRVYAQVRESSRGLRAEFPGLAPLVKGRDTYLLELPVGPGRFFLDLWFYNKKNVIEWHTANITVAGWPEISDVAWSKGNLLANDRLVVSFNVRPHFHRPRGCTAHARATDSLGRVVAQNAVPVSADGGAVQLPLNFADLIANFVKVELFVADVEGRPLTPWDLERATYSHVYMPVRAGRVSCCSFTVEAPVVAEYNARAALRALAAAGVDTVCVSSTEDARFHLAELNLRPIPDLAQLVQRFDSAPIEVAAEIRDTVPAYWAVGSTLYSLGELTGQGDAERKVEEAIRSIDRDARVGGRPSAAEPEAIDWHAVASTEGFLVAPSDSPALHKVRSYRPPESYAALCLDNAGTPADVWRQAFLQMQGVWLPQPLVGAYASDDRLDALAATVAELRSGIGFLLSRATPAKPGIAILDGAPGEAALIAYLQSRAYPFDFVAPVEVKAGKLNPYKILVAPAGDLPEDLVPSIKEFEARGGRVASNPDPATLNLDGVAPAILFSDKGGAFSGEAAAFTFGQAALFAFLGNPATNEKTSKFSFNAAGKNHLYDLRRGKHLGRGKTVSVTLPRGAAAVFSMLPYEVAAIEVVTVDTIRPGRRLPLSVSLQTKGEKPGPHVVHVEFGPLDGPPLTCYAQDLICHDGQGSTFIPLAFNEAPGNYVLTARDVLTGVFWQARVTVL